MNQELISIIVPIYNVEVYLRQCIDSILAQTYTNIEVLLINDGSPDNSAAICREYEAKDSRIRYFEKENGGLADARNYGIDKSNGSYITFIDSDDWVNEDYVEVLYHKLVEYRADISVANYYQFRESDANFLFHIFDEWEEVYESRYVQEHCFEIENGDYFFATAWGSLFKKSLFDSLRFPKGVLSEDAAITYRLYALSERIVYINKAIYCYRIRQESIIGEYSEKIILDSLHNTQEKLVLLTLMGYDVSSSMEHYIRFLQLNEYNLRITGRTDTEAYRRLKENLELLKAKGIC